MLGSESSGVAKLVSRVARKVRSERGFTGGAKGSALVACWESLQERGCSRQKGGSGQALGKYAGNWVRGSEWLKHGLQGAERGWDRGWGHANREDAGWRFGSSFLDSQGSRRGRGLVVQSVDCDTRATINRMPTACPTLC